MCMALSQTPKHFAFGNDEYHLASCPAVVAGKRVSGPTLTVAERYDDVVRDGEDAHEGTIGEEKAKQYWEEAIESLEEEVQQLMDERKSAKSGSCVSEELNEQIAYTRKAIEEGEEVHETVFS